MNARSSGDTAESSNTNLKSGELTLAINWSKIAFRGFGDGFFFEDDAACAGFCLFGACEQGMEGLDVEACVEVVLDSFCLGSSGFGIATVALAICGLGVDLLAAWLARRARVTGALGLAQLTEEGSADASALPFRLFVSSLLPSRTIG